MLRHKLNQAKKTGFQLKKYVHFQMFHFFLCLSIPKPHDVQMDMLVHKLTLEHSDK